MGPEDADESRPEDEQARNECNATHRRTKRRTFLRAASVSALATTTWLAGCNTTQTRRYEARPVSLATAAEEQGYELSDESTSEVSRTEEAGGVTLEITLISHLASYERDGTGFVQTPTVGLASTPLASEAGANLNPITERSTRDLLTGDVGRAFLRQVDIEPDWLRGPEPLATGAEWGDNAGTLLGTEVEVETFVGITADDEFALLNVARVEDGDDEVLVGDARTKAVENTDRPFVGENGYITQEMAAQSAELFIELLSWVVHEDDTGTPTGDGAEGTAEAFRVVQSGLTESQFDVLVAELSDRFGADPERFSLQNGTVQYVDADNYKALPTTEAEPEWYGNEDERPDRAQQAALDFDAIERMPEPPNPDETAAEFADALREAEALPQAGEFPGEIDFGITQPHVRIVGVDDTERLHRPIETVIHVHPTLEGTRLTGPGATINATFAMVDGEPRLTQFHHAFQAIEPAGPVRVTGASRAQASYRETLGLPEGAEVDETHAEMVYYAPEPGRGNDNPQGSGAFEPSMLLPFFELGGTAVQGEQEVTLMETYKPAVADERRPTVQLEASGEGNEVQASVSVSNGQPPYRVEWSASAMVSVPSLDDGDPASLTFEVGTREPIDETEVTAAVVDANGVPASASTTVSVDAPAVEGPESVSRSLGHGAASTRSELSAGSLPSSTTRLRGGRADYGFENGNLSYKKGVGKGFIRRMRNAGVAESYSYWGTWAWENDFKAPHDNDYGIDTADMIYYCGHANPGGWSFNDNSHDDGRYGRNDGGPDWGDYDAEWLALFACGPMHPLDATEHEQKAPHHTPAPAGKDIVCNACGGQELHERWGDNFDGMHILLGSQAGVAYSEANPSFGDNFGKFLVGAGPLPALSVIQSWFLTFKIDQPHGRPAGRGFDGRGRVLFPIDSQGRCPIDDHFWGYGPVGPDIPDSEIRWWCTFDGG